MRTRFSALIVMLAATLVVGIQHSPSANAASCMAPSVPSSGTEFGVSLSTSHRTLAQDRRAEEARFGRLPILRVFDPDLPPTNWSRINDQLPGRQLNISFKMRPQAVLSGQYDNHLRSFFRSAPTNRAIYWTYYHEPERSIINGKFSKAQFKSAFQRISRIAGESCKSNLFPTLVLTGWTAEPASRRDWRTYYPGDNYISVLGWDPYNSATGNPTRYKSAHEIFSNPIAKSRAAGKPFAISETGTARLRSDSSGRGRAAWIAQMGSYLKANNAVFVTYFQSTNNGDFELRDTPSINAYKALVSATSTSPDPARATSSDNSWKYWARGNRPSDWHTTGFNDSNWPQGPAELGFGDGDESTRLPRTVSSKNPTTYYFRNRVNFDRRPSSATLSLVADDGAVVYVNGTEVVRDNMPGGRVGNSTRASSNRTGSAERTARTFTIPPSALRAGSNVIAVEVHQQWSSSSDLSFKAILTGRS